MAGIIGKKIGMTSIFDEERRNIACTLIEAGPCVVTQVKSSDGKDGYDAIQLGFQEKKEKHATKAEVGHFKKNQKLELDAPLITRLSCTVLLFPAIMLKLERWEMRDGKWLT